MLATQTPIISPDLSQGKYKQQMNKEATLHLPKITQGMETDLST